MDQVHDDVSLIAGRLNLAHAELVEATQRLIDDELWAGGGIVSPEHWLVLRAGLSPARARDITRLARRRTQLPSMTSALDDGQLSVDQAAVIAKYAPAALDAAITELAISATVPQLRRSLSRYQFGDEAPTTSETAAEAASAAEAGSETAAGSDTGSEASSASPDTGEGPTEAGEPGTSDGHPAGGGRAHVPPAHEPELVGTLAWASAPPELSMNHRDGRFHLSYSAPADIGALVEQAIREATDALFQAGHEKVTLADGLAEVANRSLSTIAGTPRASKYRVYVHLSTSGAWINGRGAIPTSLAAKFACDGIIQPLWETQGRPVSIGRDQRIVPARTRRLIEDRDRGCRYPGCTATGHLEVHHLDHWANGGATDYERMLCLCPFHHDAHHRNEFTMNGDPTTAAGVTFANPRGLRIQVPRPDGLPPPGSGPTRATDHDPDRSHDPRPYTGPTGEVLHQNQIYLSPHSRFRVEPNPTRGGPEASRGGLRLAPPLIPDPPSPAAQPLPDPPAPTGPASS